MKNELFATDAESTEEPKKIVDPGDLANPPGTGADEDDMEDEDDFDADADEGEDEEEDDDEHKA